MEFNILGPLTVEDGGRQIALTGARQRALVAILLVHHGEVVSAERLIEELYDGRPPTSAATALRAHVSRVRSALGGDDVLVTRAGGYALEVPPDAVDSVRFEQLVRSARTQRADGAPDGAAASLQTALAMWRGPPLVDFAYKAFAQPEIARLEELRLAAVEEQMEVAFDLGRHSEVVGELERLIREFPHRERLRGQLMVALYRSGRQAEALDAFTHAREALLEELGIEPSPELRELHRAILNQDAALGSPRRSRSSPLPRPATALIDRKKEVSEVRTLLLDEARLVTITGPGGSGKTRVALEVARSLETDFDKQVRFVSLASLGDGALVPATVLAAVGGKEVPGETPTATTVRALSELEYLLVLDNFEHLLGAAGVLADLLAACPGLALLVTSRAPLHLAAEHEYPLQPLELQHAVALFNERARAARPRFAGDDLVVTTVCRRLDCLPLALELAAARSRLLTPEELVERLDHALSVLTGGPRDLAERQQTLRATIDWSYALLSRDEQRVFARLSVFRGGCTLEAAEAVCRASLGDLESLVEHSLLMRREPTGRFWLLETIREYALERLELDGASADAARRAHADHYVAYAESHVRSVDRAEPSAVARYELELDNFRTALDWLESTDPAAFRGLASALSPYWHGTGRLTEGRSRLQAVVEQEQPPSRELAVVTAELAHVLCFLGESEAAAQHAEEAIELAEALELADVLAEALNTKHLVLHNQGRSDEALGLLERAIDVARSDDPGGTPLLRALYNLAYQVRARDRLPEARAIDLEGLELARESGHKSYETDFLGHLCDVSVRMGAWRDALEIEAELETDPVARPDISSLSQLPWLHVQRGEVAHARDLLAAHGHLAEADEVQARVYYALGEAVVLRTEGKPRDALARALAAVAARSSLGPHDEVTLAFVEAVEAAFDLDDLGHVSTLLDGWADVRPLERPSSLEAHLCRFRARLAARRGDGGALDSESSEATATFRQLSMPFYVAVTLLEHGEALLARGAPRDAPPLLDEARVIFEGLDARPWLERLGRAGSRA